MIFFRQENRLVGSLRGNEKLIWEFGEIDFNRAVNWAVEYYNKYVVKKTSELA